jgi:methylthioribose-1-phosphate isomerase
MLPTIKWDKDKIIMLDQRKLPGEEVYLECRDHEEVADAIEKMAIRGAPAIGVAAAFGLALGFLEIDQDAGLDA